MSQSSKLMNRNFFLLWQGQTISQLGVQAFNIALLFWIKHATGSATLMGLILMVSTLPAVLLGPISGTVADRYSRRAIIILTDAISGVAVLFLTALFFIMPDATNVILVWLFVVSILKVVANSFFGPAITASIPDLVPKNKITGANSLIQLSLQLSIFIGQGIGGVLFRLLGAPLLFLIDGVTYLISAFSETFITIPQKLPKKSSTWQAQFTEFKKDIVEGFRFIWDRAGLRELVLVSALLNFFTIPIIILLPFYVEDFLKVEVDWYGFLLAAYSVGSLIGYLSAGAIQFSGPGRAKIMLLFFFIEPVGYGLLGFVNNPFIAMALAFLGGLMGGFILINITTILQVTTPSQTRGRVFGLMSTISASVTPIGMGLAGVVADLTGQNIPLIYGACGGIMLVLITMISLNPKFRHFLAYEHKADEALEEKTSTDDEHSISLNQSLEGVIHDHHSTN